MNTNMTKAWEQYEAGKAYKRRIGLYERVRQNERFYRGDQWFGSSAAAELPKPVFNVIRRVVDYLICSVAATEKVTSAPGLTVTDLGWAVMTGRPAFTVTLTSGESEDSEVTVLPSTLAATTQ